MGVVPVAIVDPRDYRSFCFRGEGRANFVISAKCERTGLRIVWRFAKQRKSGMVTVKSKSEMVNSYMNKFVTPFFSPEYLVAPRMVNFRIGDVHQLAKIPSLRNNLKVERFEELMTLDTDMSFLPMNTVPRGVTRLTALEMLDATRIPREIALFNGPTITVEVKPKQGYYQQHAGYDTPHCNNCVLQIQKCSSDAFDRMYDFCPLDLYSGDLTRMRSSVHALLKEPHRNLRVFVNGDLVHSDESLLANAQLNSLLFPEAEADTDDLVDALVCCLSGMPSPSSTPFHLSPPSVLSQILQAQRVDTIGIAQAHAIFKELSRQAQEELKNKSALSKKTLRILEGSDPRSLLERYLLAATMKDCSVMVSLRLIPQQEVENAQMHAEIVRVRDLFFAFSVKIVDLDPKGAKNLVNAFERFRSGSALIHEDPHLRRPCVSTVEPLQ